MKQTILLFFSFVFIFLSTTTPFSYVFASPQKNEDRPVFPKGELIIEGKTVKIEIARTQDQHAYGLMNRTELAADAGMLFIFDKEETQTFWMKNTLIPLSIGFFDRNQRLVDSQEMVPMTTKYKTYSSEKPALYALEMKEKWFSDNHISKKSKFTFTEKK